MYVCTCIFAAVYMLAHWQVQRPEYQELHTMYPLPTPLQHCIGCSSNNMQKRKATQNRRKKSHLLDDIIV